MALHMNRPARIGEVSNMSLVRWLFVVGLALAACGCKSSGNISGYDGDSPAGSESDWCSQSPPSGYCNSKGD